MRNIRLSVPDNAKSGDVIELKAMIRHDMESGYRVNIQGQTIARNILTFFECRFDDNVIFSADFHPGVSANPLLKFHMRAQKSGTLTFEWTEQTGQIFTKTAALAVLE
ncbi:MAG: thiosulfate oxidation carrier complex protein SoxZ [Hellea sp.]|nr:thiosulfate oxidation carrier complex protein SoxZ [Hellea sp.]